MSDDRFLIIKDCIKSNGKWDILQELCHDYRVVFQRVLLLHNLDDDIIGIHLEFKDNEYDNFIKYIYDKIGILSKFLLYETLFGNFMQLYSR